MTRTTFDNLRPRLKLPLIAAGDAETLTHPQRISRDTFARGLCQPYVIEYRPDAFLVDSGSGCQPAQMTNAGVAGVESVGM